MVVCQFRVLVGARTVAVVAGGIGRKEDVDYSTYLWSTPFEISLPQTDYSDKLLTAAQCVNVTLHYLG